MATSAMNPVMQHLRMAVLEPVGAGMTDGQLLESFITRQDEAAFQALVRRHGPMVMGVCRRVLHRHHDAEDAFQATFLVLVRKAPSLRTRELLANWLYGVAHNTALKARAMNAKRKVRERQVREMPEPETSRHALWDDLQLVLDQELSRLPAKYRLPIILCDLESKSIQEAARNLGCPQGTLAGRLARARTMLAKRLSRHGLAVSGGLFAALLSQNPAPASVPISLAISTFNAAGACAAGRVATGMISANVAALMNGVVKGMMLTKLKTVTTVMFIVALFSIGVGAMSYTASAGGPPESVLEARQEKTPVAAPLKAGFTITAQGNRVAIEGTDFRAFADRAAYQESKGLLILEGINEKVMFWRRGDNISGTKVYYWLNNGILKSENVDLEEQPKQKGESKTGSMILGIGVNSDAGVSGSLIQSQPVRQDVQQSQTEQPPRTGQIIVRGNENLGNEARQKIRKVAPLFPPMVLSYPLPAQDGELDQQQAERLMKQVFADKADLADLPITMMIQSKRTWMATCNFSVDKGGRARLEPFRAVIYGKGNDAEATVIMSGGAILTFDKPISTVSEVGNRKIVATQFIGNAETKTVSVANEIYDKARRRELNPDGSSR